MTDSEILQRAGGVFARLLRAEEAHIFLGEVPHFSDDHEEQERISYYRRKIVRERARAETCLLNLIGRRVNERQS